MDNTDKQVVCEPICDEPNADTVEAIKELESGRGTKFKGKTRDFINEIIKEQ